MLGGLLAGTLVLTACQANGLTPGPSPSGKKGPATKAEETPRPGGTVGPAGTPEPTAKPGDPLPPVVTPGPTGTPAIGPVITPTPAAVAPLINLLHKPTGTVTLNGLVKLDGGYIVAAGAGNVLSHNGGSIVAAGAGNVLSHNGGLVLSHNGGAIVAAGAGNMVAAGAGNLVAAGAGNLVAAGAGNLVAAGAGNLVAAGAGNLVAAGAGNILPSGAGRRYALAQVAPTPSAASLAVGTVVPVAGVEIGVWSIPRRTLLPLGVDRDGKPVFTVYSNLTGGYEVYVPESEKGNVIVLAMVERESPDPRLTYGVMAPVEAAKAVEVDEDATLVTGYLREALAGQLMRAFLPGGVELVFKAVAVGLPSAAGVAGETVKGFFQRLQDRGAAIGLKGDTPAGRRAARRVSDYVLERITLAEVGFTYRPPWYDGPEEAPMAVFKSVAETLRTQTTAKLAVEPNYHERTFFWKALESRGETMPVIKRPTDFGALAIDYYFRELVDARLESLTDKSAPNYTRHDVMIYRALRTMFTNLGAIGVPSELADEKAAFKSKDPAKPLAYPRLVGGHDQVDRLNMAVQNVMARVVLEILAIESDPAEVEKAMAMLEEAPASSPP